jgi:hypothetical protein
MILEDNSVNDNLINNPCYDYIEFPPIISTVTKIFEQVLNFITEPYINSYKFIEDIHNYLLFTILLLEEKEREWILYICGDGFVITQDYEDNIEFHDIDHCSAPMYLAYVYINSENLDLSEDEKYFVKNNIFKTFSYRKADYKAVGIASDGIAYVIGSEFQEDFKEALLKRKDFLVKRLINKLNYKTRKIGGSGFFKDDITISMR